MDTFVDNWERLDSESKEALVENGVVEYADHVVTVTSADSWADDWRPESNAAWPEYELAIHAGADEKMRVIGWHVVGPMGPDANLPKEQWDCRDDDGAFDGRPRVDEWTVKPGAHMSGGGPIPLWKEGNQWVTFDPSALNDDLGYAADEAAAEADHGDEPTYEDADNFEIQDTVWIVVDGEPEEVDILQGGAAIDGRELSGWPDRDFGLKRKFWATGWTHTLAENEKWASKKEALADIVEYADDGKLYESLSEAESAVATDDDSEETE
jgi:hypothetical protein